MNCIKICRANRSEPWHYIVTGFPSFVNCWTSEETTNGHHFHSHINLKQISSSLNPIFYVISIYGRHTTNCEFKAFWRHWKVNSWRSPTTTLVAFKLLDLLMQTAMHIYIFTSKYVESHILTNNQNVPARVRQCNNRSPRALQKWSACTIAEVTLSVQKMKFSDESLQKFLTDLQRLALQAYPNIEAQAGAGGRPAVFAENREKKPPSSRSIHQRNAIET